MLHSRTMPEFLGSILEQVHLTTLVDIGIVSLLIYWLFSLIRGTRAVRLVIGVSVLFVVYVLAVAFGLQLLTAILQGGAVVGLFALVVIFQPEIRRGLDRIGRVGSLGWLLSPADSRAVGARRRRGRPGRRRPVRRGPRRAHRPRARDRPRGGRRERRDDPRRRLGRPASARSSRPRTPLHDGARHHPRRDDPRRRRAPAAGRDDRPVRALRDPPSGGPRASPSRPTRSSSSCRRRTARSASSSARASCATSTRRQLARSIRHAPRPEPGAPPRRVRVAPGTGADHHLGRTGAAVTRVLADHRPQLAPQAGGDRARDPALRRPGRSRRARRRSTGSSRSRPSASRPDTFLLDQLDPVTEVRYFSPSGRPADRQHVQGAGRPGDGIEPGSGPTSVPVRVTLDRGSEIPVIGFEPDRVTVELDAVASRTVPGRRSPRSPRPRA